MIRWGVIGCGEATEKKSGPAFQQIQGSKIEAVMSRNAERARSYAERHGINKWYTNVMDIIDDPNVNAVYIATPPSSHATYAIMALRAGKPVYIEKPMAASYEDCIRINRACEETGVPCFVAYYRRYLPYFKKVEELIPRVGKVINVHIRLAQPPREFDGSTGDAMPWRVQANIAGGGYFYDLAPHQLDLLQHYFGYIIEAKGYTANRGGLYDAEDSISATFRFDNGLVGSGSWCFVAHESAREDRIEIIGDQGMLCFSVFTYEPIELNDQTGHHKFSVPNPQHVQQPLIENIVQHLRKEGICTCNGLSATPTNWAMDRILGKI